MTAHDLRSTAGMIGCPGAPGLRWGHERAIQRHASDGPALGGVALAAETFRTRGTEETT